MWHKHNRKPWYEENNQNVTFQNCCCECSSLKSSIFQHLLYLSNWESLATGQMPKYLFIIKSINNFVKNSLQLTCFQRSSKDRHNTSRWHLGRVFYWESCLIEFNSTGRVLKSRPRGVVVIQLEPIRSDWEIKTNVSKFLHAFTLGTECGERCN